MLRAIANLPEHLHRRLLQKKKELDSFRGLPLSADVIKRVEEQMEIEYVYNSNKIEGSTLNLGETALVLKGMTVNHQNLPDVLAARNHPGGMKFIQNMAFDSYHKITEDDIKKVHLMIAEKLVPHPGEYRQSDEYRVLGAEFTPPPFYEIPQHMSELIEFINENPDELTPVELAGHAHYHLAWIHPFENVNGRTARLLLNFILIRNRYPFIVIKDVERKKYRHTLNLADNGDFGPFLEFIARSAEQTLDTYLSAIKGEQGEEFLTLTELAKGTPYPAEYLSLQVRKGIIDAVKKGKTWFTTKKTIDTYIEQHGRKKFTKNA